MPYVDEGEREPINLPPILPFIALVIAMGAGIALYWAFYTQLSYNQWLAPLVTGPAIGAAMRFTVKRPLPRQGLIAVLATVATCLVGYVLRHLLWIVWVDPTFQPTVGHAFNWLFSKDLMAFLLIAFSAYLAFTIGGGVPRLSPQQTGQA